jgi:sugar O-acyltransferase (sialic acid O-acetyltransferase NeuD family)
MTQELVIIGASGFGKEVAFLVEDLNRAAAQPPWRLLGFLDDDPGCAGGPCLGYPVLGTLDWLRGRKEPVAAVVAIGSPAVRARVVERLRGLPAWFPPLIHPTVVRHASCNFGEGVVVCAGTILTVEVTVGRHVHLNLDCTVGHGARLGEFCTLYPGVHVSGDVTLGAQVSMGTGSVVLQGITIGAGTFLGAGATAVRDLPAGVVAVGCPAKPLPRRDGEQ